MARGDLAGTGNLLFSLRGEHGGALDSGLPAPQTALAVQAVEKDHAGDAAAAFSLYCKALDFFVPALRCEHLGLLGAEGGGRQSCSARIPEAACHPDLWETRQRANPELHAFGDSESFGVAQGSPTPDSCKPPLSTDEVDTQRKEAIKAKVGEWESPEGMSEGWGTPGTPGTGSQNRNFLSWEGGRPASVARDITAGGSH